MESREAWSKESNYSFMVVTGKSVFFFLVEVVQGNSFIFSASRESRANDFQLVSTIFER